MKLVVVIPTYQNPKTIGAVVRASALHGYPVWVINDGSTDSTQAEAEASGARVISHAVNRGKGEALKTAFAAARAEGFSHVLTIDGDGQHEPADIPALVALAGPDNIVLGTRTLSVIPEKNRFGNRVSNYWVNLAMLRFGPRRLRDTQCGLRIYPLAALPALGGHGYELETEVLIRHARNKKPITPVPVSVYYPPAEERVSHFVPKRDATRIVFLVMRFLFLPRFLWAAVFMVACAGPASQPVAGLPSAAIEPRQQALQQTHVAYSSHQRLHYDGPGGQRQSEGLFMVQPGKAYRLRVLGPMAITMLDVQVRCGRFKLDGGDKHVTGRLSEAAALVPFFPVEALFWMTAPLSDGQWQGTTFVARNGIAARVDEAQKSFVQFADQSGVRIDVRAFTEVQPGFLLPRVLYVEMGPRGRMSIENDDLSLDVPDEQAMAGEVTCGS